jgi:dihydrofolate reductase
VTNYVYIATSLDGYIATSDGGLNWLLEVPNPEQSDYGFAEFIEGIDAIVMGRNTFETVVSFGVWPYERPVFVLSEHLKEIPGNLAGKAELTSGEVLTLVQELRRRGYENLYVDGGLTIQSFLAVDMIDELIITRLPVVLGAGIPLFGELAEMLQFEHVGTEVYNNALVKSHYVRANR